MISLTPINRRRVLGSLLQRVDAYTLWAFNAPDELSYRSSAGKSDRTAA